MTNDASRDLIGGARFSRRHVLGLGAAGLGAAFLAACGGDDSSSSTTAAATGSSTASSGGGAALDKLKAHWVYVGPPDDNGWSQTHDLGRQAAVKALGAKLESGFTPNVGFDASTTQLFEKLVSDGNKLIFANTEYAKLMSDVAVKHPDVKFVECDGHVFTANEFAYYMAHETTAYLMGMAAGLLAKSGKIGYIGAFPSATAYNDVNGLLLGARSVNPAATVKTVLVNTFFDAQKAAQAAEALLNDGVEFLFGVMDEPTYLQKAEAAGVWTGYWNVDGRKFAPTKYVNNFDLSAWGGFYTSQCQAVLDGTWKAPDKVTLLDCPLDKWGDKVPADVQKQVDDAAAKVKSGALKVYQGPLKDNKGNVKLKDGETLDSLGAYAIDWAVDGVTGV